MEMDNSKLQNKIRGEIKYADLKKFDEYFEQYCLPAKKAYLLRSSIELALNTDNTRPLFPKFESNEINK